MLQAVMSSSSIVTYTAVYSESEPWRLQWDSDDEMEAPDACNVQPSRKGYHQLRDLRACVLITDHLHQTYVAYTEEPEQGNHYFSLYLLMLHLQTLSPGYVADSNSEKNEEEDYANYPAMEVMMIIEVLR
ncbi:hypothetical protein Tco_0967863 [Tanacetum coccineum]